MNTESEKFFSVIKSKLTPKQQEVIRLYAEGYSVIEIAEKLNITRQMVTGAKKRLESG